MALLFIGIQKIASDIMLKNPMANMQAEVIFSRVLGTNDIQNAEVWIDSNQCYICDRWCKTRIEYKENDENVMKQNINRVLELDEVIK